MNSRVGFTNESDALLIPLHNTPELNHFLEQLDHTHNTGILRQAAREGFEAKPGQVIFSPTPSSHHQSVIAFGVGAEEEINSAILRKGLTAAFGAARKTKAKDLVFNPWYLFTDAASPAVNPADLGHLIAETAGTIGFVPRVAKTTLGGYTPGAEFGTLTIMDGQNDDLSFGLKTGTIFAQAINAGRNMANLRSNEMGPDEFREAALAVAAKSGGSITATYLDKKQLKRIGAGGILAVNRGSKLPCYLIVLTYTPPTGPTNTHLGLIGKTVTYDTGGLSIKPNEGMADMHRDKTGGVCVLSALSAIAELGYPLSVSAIFPVTDNAVGPKAWQPGDTVTTLSGHCFINANSDAEGRVIQADAITYAQSVLKVTHLVCASTLTGAARIVASSVAALLYSNDDGFERLIKTASQTAGENFQVMEMFPEFEELLDNSYADFQSISAAGGGATIAASFLRKFVQPQTRWAHMDIASVSWKESKDDPGATGFSIRTLIRTAQKLSQQG
jgi:leucyl aminopeptidase